MLLAAAAPAWVWFRSPWFYYFRRPASCGDGALVVDGKWPGERYQVRLPRVNIAETRTYSFTLKNLPPRRPVVMLTPETAGSPQVIQDAGAQVRCALIDSRGRMLWRQRPIRDLWGESEWAPGNCWSWTDSGGLQAGFIDNNIEGAAGRIDPRPGGSYTFIVEVVCLCPKSGAISEFTPVLHWPSIFE